MLDLALSVPPLRALPVEVVGILRGLDASPRLAAHLRAVHDVAVEVVDWLGAAYPGVVFDRDAVLFGAATHDIGKVVHPEELSAPGVLHEAAGPGVLMAAGVEERLARFAGTHGSWGAPGIEIEDLLVSLADKVWKAKRVPDLEDRVVAVLAASSGQEAWEVFLGLDDRLDRLAAGADARLEFQNAFRP